MPKPTLSWNGRRLVPRHVAYFAALHGLALLAPWHFSWGGLLACLILYWLSCSAGICFGYHRLLTHRSFRVGKPLEYLASLCGALASEGGPVTWVAMHRMHHQLSDRPGRDLHTPKDGFWWSHLGWVVCETEIPPRELERRFAPELLADPFHRLLTRVHLLPNLLVGAVLYALGGWSYLIWGGFLRIVVGLHATWFVNSAAHTFGYRTYTTPEGSTNCWWVGLLAWGEGWHNNHHAFQRSARHGLQWWEFDATWLLIRTLSGLRLVRDVQALPRGAERFRIEPRLAA